jgi:thioredoxin-related protein
MSARFASILLLCALLVATLARAAETRDPYTYFFNANTGDFRAELADAKNAGKKAIFVLFEQEGCPGCLHMKNHVLNRPDVQKFYRERFVNFTVDIYSAVPITDFAGRGVTEKDYARSLRVKGTPTLLFYDLAGKEVLRIVGPVRDADEFMRLGEFVASGAYLHRKFAE